MIEDLLIYLINDPYNDINNFNLAYEYELIGQTASALSYYLRCSEFTSNIDLSYESLLRMSHCLSLQSNRDNKELSCIQHAITINPNRPEAYYIMSLYYSYRKKWLESYMYSILGIEQLNKNFNPLIHNFKYNNDYDLYYQKALSGFNKGKINESKQIYFDLLNNYQLNDNIIQLINNNLKLYPEPMSKPIYYTKDKYDKLKFKFNNSEKIIKNYSQIYQDMFVLTMTNGIENGSYLEIGSGDPIYGNNTYLLEKEFNWNGLSIDINELYKLSFTEKRNNKFICENALTIDYYKLLNDNFKINIIDYLQIDCDPCDNSYEVLLKIPFDKYHFKVITFEHDYYNDKSRKFRNKSRGYLIKLGYHLIGGNISPNYYENPFEDWYIHPDYISKDIYKQFINTQNKFICGESFMFIKHNLHLIFFGDNLFEKQKLRLNKQALNTNWFQSITIESPETIKPFITMNKNIFKYKRGFGYWLWKPYIISLKLSKLKKDEILVYLDCGSTIQNNNIILNNYLKILNDKSIIVFANSDHLEKQFQKNRLLKHFNLDNDNEFLNSNHIESGCLLIKKNEESLNFIKQWLQLCEYNNYELLNDCLDSESTDFIEHRHDQSILSILSKQSNIVHIMNNNDLYQRNTCFFSSRLTDNGPRKYAKSLN